jgi:hypothetical protein
MKFEWDPQKNATNLQKHGLDFADAHFVFDHPMLVKLDDREEYEGDRSIGIGLLALRVVVVIFTEPHSDTIRLISFRKATSDERKRYEKAYQDEFGAS